MGHPLPFLTKVNKEMISRTEQTWPQSNDTVPVPGGIITFSNDDLYRPEPNHNQPLFVSVEYRNKVVRRAYIDQGSCLNLLPGRVFYELGYTAEDLAQDTRSLA